MDSFLMKRSQNGSLVSSSCTDFTTLLPQQHHDTPKFDDVQQHDASIALNVTLCSLELQPRFSRAALFLPFHIFFYNLIGLFVLRNARNQYWSGEHVCVRLRVKPLDPESCSYERQCCRRGRRVLVCSKLFTVTCLVTCSSWAGIDNKKQKCPEMSQLFFA